MREMDPYTDLFGAAADLAEEENIKSGLKHVKAKYDYDRPYTRTDRLYPPREQPGKETHR